MAWKPDVTVAALVQREGRFLLVEERIAGRRVINQPAGHVEDGESLRAAVIRETLEETAWHFVPEALLGLYLWRSPRGHSTLRIAFIGSVSRHEPERALDPPVLATHWLTRDQLLARRAQHRTPLVLRCIDDFLSGQRLPLSALASDLLESAAALPTPPTPPTPATPPTQATP
jgi:8-oxo-dGTP pyrophosphatase MutT (NUDIX family)